MSWTPRFTKAQGVSPVQRARPGHDGPGQRPAAFAGWALCGVRRAQHRLRRQQGRQRDLCAGPAQAAASRCKVVDKGGSARWSADGHSLYFVAPAKGVAQLWRVDLGGKAGLDLAAARGAGAGAVMRRWTWAASSCRRTASSVLLSYEVFTDCADLACTKERIDGARAGQGHRHALRQAVRAALGYLGQRPAQPALRRPASMRKGQLPAEPTLLSRGIDGDVPSKPFGDEERVRVRAGRQDGVFRRAHRRHDRAVVDQLRCLQRAGGRLGRAEEPHGRTTRPGMPIRWPRRTARRCTTWR